MYGDGCNYVNGLTVRLSTVMAISNIRCTVVAK